MMTAEDIKNLRSKMGLSQKELAKQLGTSTMTIYRWESGARQPLPIFRDKLETLQKKMLKETQEECSLT